MVGSPRDRRVLRGHQVEPGFGQLRFDHPRVQPPHVDPRLGGRLLAPFQRHPRHVQSGDVPPPLREPDRVGTFAASDVEHGTGRGVRHLGDQRSVGLAAPHPVGVGVALVPHCGGLAGIGHLGPVRRVGL